MGKLEILYTNITEIYDLIIILCTCLFFNKSFKKSTNSVFYLEDVVLAADDEQRNRKGTDQLSVLLTESQLTLETAPALHTFTLLVEICFLFPLTVKYLFSWLHLSGRRTFYFVTFECLKSQRHE